MIRRLFWMTAGALLGVTGYRRASRLARAVTAGGARPSDRTHRRARGDLTSGRWAHRGWTHGAASFARDVRDGMELYADRHPRLSGRTLEGQQARAERGHEAGAGGEHRHGYSGVDYEKDGT
jgi:hypothetical protein